MIVLDLCGGSGSWSAPYRDAGYEVINVTLPEYDVRTFMPPKGVRGILAAPPCTEFAVSGARWWADKGPKPLLEALGIVTACLRIIAITRPEWWALENPVGRLRDYMGPARYTFQPWEYGDLESKRTCIWGRHRIPERTPVYGKVRETVWRMGPSPERAALRSITPPGFAKAFFKANP